MSASDRSALDSHGAHPAATSSTIVRTGNQLAAYLTLAIILFTLYLITGAGRFHIIDEVSLYSVTENLVRRGAWDTDQIIWSQWVNSPAEVLGAWGKDGHVYSKKGVAPALSFVPMRLLARYLPGVGLLQTTFLASAWLTIASALLLWSTAKRLGYGNTTGMILALIYGVATLAWPYATHLFGEPLSSLALMTALWALVSMKGARRIRYSVILGGSLGVAVATNAVYALLFPLFGLAWLYTLYPQSLLPTKAKRTQFFRTIIKHSLSIGVPLFITAIFLLWYNWFRFGHVLDTGYHFEAGEGFNGSLIAGLYGLLLSPYRGIFFHQPLTFLSLIGLPLFWRRHRQVAMLTGGVVILLILIFSKWWIWWGGFAWGPRFLVPLTPYLVLWIAPTLDAMRRWIVVSLVTISAGVQLLAVSANYVLWEIELRSLYPTDWNDPLRFGAPATVNPLHSPVFGQLYLLARRQWHEVLDFAWWQPHHVFWWAPLIGLALILVGIWLLVKPRAQHRLALAVSLAAVVILFTWWTLQAYAQDPHYGEPHQDYRAILQEIENSSRPYDTLITVAPYHYHIPMNFYDGPLPILGFATEPTLHPESERLLSWALAREGTIHLITAGLSPEDPANGVERWLNEKAYRADDRWFNDFRLLHYGTTPPIISLPAETSWGAPPTLILKAVQISTLTARPGDVINLQLTWLRTGSTPPLHLFVQLLPAAPPPAAQYDSALPTDQWSPNQRQTTRVGLWIPPETPAGKYILIVGWYQSESGERLTVNGADFYPLATITVTENDP